MRLSLCITRAAQVAAAGIATSFADRSRTWDEVSDRVARLASALSGLGVGSGDRVAFVGRNSDRYLEWFFAVGWAGAVFVPVSVRLAPPEVRHVLNDSGASVLFADDEFAPLVLGLRDDLTDVRELVYAGDGPQPASDWHSYEDLIATGDRVAPAAARPSP